MTKEFVDPGWYSDAEAYWSRIDASVDGMLGGFSNVHQPDIAASTKLLCDVLADRRCKDSTTSIVACDCGAGIGRISKSLLTKFCDKVDMVEVTESFLQRAQQDEDLIKSGRMDRFIRSGLQSFSPEVGRYDIIWCQWVLGHLTDDDLVAFLKRALLAVQPKQGWVIIKENLASGGVDHLVDEEDSSVTRSEECWRRLLQEAGARLVQEQLQTGFPPGLFRVKSFVLQ